MRTRSFALAAAVVVATPLAARAQLDHLTCYKVKDSAPQAKYQATLTNSFGSQTCTVRTPAKLGCVQTSATSITPTPPGGGPSGASAAGAFLCYRAKCGKQNSSTNVQDQFGMRVVRFKASQFLCAPASVPSLGPGVVTTTVPGATTTSTTMAAQGTCQFSNGKCEGTCSGGQTCGTAVGTASCECRAVSCGNASAPQCNGACSNPGDACVFDLTGCSCVHVP